VERASRNQSSMRNQDLAREAYRVTVRALVVVH
jgi:hypothetical protein